MVLLADHNSVRDETVDSGAPAKETTSDGTSVYRKATRTAREVEVDSCLQMGLMDGWPLIRDRSEGRAIGDGGNLPGKGTKAEV